MIQSFALARSGDRNQPEWMIGFARIRIIFYFDCPQAKSIYFNWDIGCNYQVDFLPDINSMINVIADSRLNLKSRKEPQQGRAQKTYEKILSVTTVLLEEVGLDGLNTNLIAERAGVNISSLYKYFPNKHAILSTLLVRLNDKQTALLLEYLNTLEGSISWQQILSGMIDTLVVGTRHEKGLVVLQKAMLGTPGLKEVVRKSNENLAKVFLNEMEKNGVVLPVKRKKLIGTCLGEIVPVMLELSVVTGKRFDHHVIEELKRMQIGYISTYIHPDKFWNENLVPKGTK